MFEFANEIRNLEIANSDILVSFDVSSLFTNVALDETIEVLANRAFTNYWFNTAYDLSLEISSLFWVQEALRDERIVLLSMKSSIIPNLTPFTSLPSGVFNYKSN